MCAAQKKSFSELCSARFSPERIYFRALYPRYVCRRSEFRLLIAIGSVPGHIRARTHTHNRRRWASATGLEAPITTYRVQCPNSKWRQRPSSFAISFRRRPPPRTKAKPSNLPDDSSARRARSRPSPRSVIPFVERLWKSESSPRAVTYARMSGTFVENTRIYPAVPAD